MLVLSIALVAAFTLLAAHGWAALALARFLADLGGREPAPARVERSTRLIVLHRPA